jgi:hypothetical protein
MIYLDRRQWLLGTALPVYSLEVGRPAQPDLFRAKHNTPGAPGDKARATELHAALLSPATAYAPCVGQLFQAGYSIIDLPFQATLGLDNRRTFLKMAFGICALIEPVSLGLRSAFPVTEPFFLLDRRCKDVIQDQVRVVIPTRQAIFGQGTIFAHHVGMRDRPTCQEGGNCPTDRAHSRFPRNGRIIVCRLNRWQVLREDTRAQTQP